MKWRVFELYTKVSSRINRMVSSHIFIKNIEFIIKRKILQINKTPVLDCFTRELHQIFKKEVVPILHKIFQILKKVNSNASQFIL